MSQCPANPLIQLRLDVLRALALADELEQRGAAIWLDRARVEIDLAISEPIDGLPNSVFG